MTNQAPRTRPIGVTILAILAFIAAIVNIYHALQYFGILPHFLGPVRFFGVDILGALLYLVLAAIWFWVGRMLWNLDRQGWTFVVAIAVIEIVFSLLAVLGQSTFAAQLPGMIIAAIVLIYALSSGVKNAFDVP
jgi:hypothetical protein